MLEDEIARLEVYMGEKLDAADLKVEETIAQARVYAGGCMGMGGQGRGGHRPHQPAVAAATQDLRPVHPSTPLPLLGHSSHRTWMRS